MVALGELARPLARARAARSSSSSSAAVAAAISAPLVGDDQRRLLAEAGVALGRRAAVVTTALPAAIACSTFIRMPPPVRTGAITTAAASRCGRDAGRVGDDLDAGAGQGRGPPAAGALPTIRSRASGARARTAGMISPREPGRRVAVGRVGEVADEEDRPGHLARRVGRRRQDAGRRG